MAQVRSRLIILLKSLIALEKSLPSGASESWVSQRRNAATILRRMGVLSLLAQELLSQQTSPSSSRSSAPSLPPLPPFPLLSSRPSSASSSSLPLNLSLSSPSSFSSPSSSSLVSLSSSSTSSPPPPPPPPSSSLSSSSSSSPSSSSCSSSLLPSSSTSSPSSLLSSTSSSSSSLPSSSSALSLAPRPPPASPSPLPSGVLLCFQEIKNTMEKLKAILKSFEERSSIWQVLEHESLSRTLYELNHDMANALNILPLHLLQVSDEIKEQIYLIYSQLRRAQKPFIDPDISELRSKLLDLLHEELDNINMSDMHGLFVCLNLTTFADCEREIELLRKEMNMQAGTGGIPVVCAIENIICFMKHCQCLLYGKKVIGSDSPRVSCTSIYADDLSTSSSDIYALSDSPVFPDEFRCPISLDLMCDPVVVATGHTYDRESISKWVESGHKTCPKSGQHLLHMSFIPNYALRRIIHQWCIENSIPYKTDDDAIREEDEDHISLRQAALETTKETVPYLVGKLATGSLDVQRQVAYVLRLITKCGIENRICVAEAGAIPFLVPLLTSSDQRTQENAVTALLNLSICENNKSLIMAAGALDAVVEVVRAGATMEARENAAATLFSLSMVNDYKVAIGAKQGAIPALVALIKEGSPRGKKDAATALFNLCIVMENKAKVIEAGAIPLLIDLLNDEKAGITDDSLAVLAVLAERRDWCVAMDQAKAIPLLVDLLRVGSARGKEHALAVLLALCKHGGEDVVRSVFTIDAALPSLQRIAEIGSARAKRKAYSLLKLFKKLQH